jgi:hypothetical protein
MALPKRGSRVRFNGKSLFTETIFTCWKRSDSARGNQTSSFCPGATLRTEKA